MNLSTNTYSQTAEATGSDQSERDWSVWAQSCLTSAMSGRKYADSSFYIIEVTEIIGITFIHTFIHTFIEKLKTQKIYFSSSVFISCFSWWGSDPCLSWPPDTFMWACVSTKTWWQELWEFEQWLQVFGLWQLPLKHIQNRSPNDSAAIWHVWHSILCGTINRKGVSDCFHNIRDFTSPSIYCHDPWMLALFIGFLFWIL